jgi:maltose O-acetyltransferase
MTRKLRRLLLLFVAPSRLLGSRGRVAVLRRCGLRVGPEVIISPGIQFLSEDVLIGHAAFINRGCLIDALWSPIVIGERVYIGQQVRILTASHKIGPGSQRAGASVQEPVTISAGTWIGAGATILPGVTIGEGCVIAAGAVVTRDCAPHGLYGGLPARRIRDLPAGEP